MAYLKGALAYQEQLALLQKRGLNIADTQKAINHLKHVSYYRLSPYFIPFQLEKDVFCPNTDLDDVFDLYVFDRKLRLLFLDAIEVIEVSVRASMTYQLAQRYGAFGYMEKSTFSQNFNYEKWVQDIIVPCHQSKEDFVKHFHGKYKSEAHLPIWMITELLSFGSLSRLFSQGLLFSDKKAIAKQYKVDEKILISWLHTMVYLRNICAHHARLWNRILRVKPKIPRLKDFEQLTNRNERVFILIKIIGFLLSVINPESTWVQRLQDIFITHPKINYYFMGFPKNFQPNDLKTFIGF
jgi:abortive infection bacteriophage resistance protein